ncbi:MAG: 23S rRNA (adenine(2503)-C(2))-methyltransferase RlmN [Desulfovibrionaceae bacterium]|nr:23S rRNA (adenine(2503)-C(2))-methyltransferase RlmN [Desulfovibrionaceae bacterium]
MPNILDLTYSELEDYFVKTLQEPKFRTLQVWQWLYKKLCQDFEGMSNLKVTARLSLKEHFTLTWPEIVETKTSQDGTKKLLLKLSDGSLIETVLIPTYDHAGKVRYAQCLSTQVGCPMGCTFCATGATGFTRNLTHAEIVGQVLVGKKELSDLRSDRPILKNVVFMGMGEPLLNLNNLLRALTSLNHKQGLAFSPRRITVSTCGIKEGLEELGKSGLCYLAVSLHAPNQALRAKIMPKASQFELKDLISALKNYPLKPREFITFEYLLLKNVNDSLQEAQELAKLVSQLKGKLNLIIFNPSKDLPYEAPDPKTVLAFEEVLWQKKLTAIVRESKGQDIAAACGQLRAERLACSSN